MKEIGRPSQHDHCVGLLGKVTDTGTKDKQNAESRGYKMTGRLGKGGWRCVGGVGLGMGRPPMRA